MTEPFKDVVDHIQELVRTNDPALIEYLRYIREHYSEEDITTIKSQLREKL